MSSYCYTYQHTCRISHDAFLLHNAPFKSPIINAHKGVKKIPFLGEGYYFWEENVEAATRWGIKHYSNKYRIVEYVDVILEVDELLNLTDRRDIKYFKELQKMYIEKRPDSERWPIGTWIEFFKKLNTINELKFPFSYIKADEHLPERERAEYDREKTYFSEGLYFTYFAPLYMLCIIDKKQLKFETKRLIGGNG